MAIQTTSNNSHLVEAFNFQSNMDRKLLQVGNVKMRQIDFNATFGRSMEYLLVQSLHSQGLTVTHSDLNINSFNNLCQVLEIDSKYNAAEVADIKRGMTEAVRKAAIFIMEKLVKDLENIKVTTSSKSNDKVDIRVDGKTKKNRSIKFSLEIKGQYTNSDFGEIQYSDINVDDLFARNLTYLEFLKDDTAAEDKWLPRNHLRTPQTWTTDVRTRWLADFIQANGFQLSNAKQIFMALIEKTYAPDAYDKKKTIMVLQCKVSDGPVSTFTYQLPHKQLQNLQIRVDDMKKKIKYFDYLDEATNEWRRFLKFSLDSYQSKQIADQLNKTGETSSKSFATNIQVFQSALDTFNIM